MQEQQKPRLRRAALWTAFVLAGLAAAPAVHAQAEPQSVNIAAQPLGAALDALAAQAKIKLLYSPDAVKGKTAPALTGWHAPEAALSRLLAGSGLIYVLSDGTYAIKPAPVVESVTRLAPIEVKGATQNDYVARRATAATKTSTPLLETPMAVQVVPREVIDDRQTMTSLEAVKNVSGVQTPPGMFYDRVFVRGFDAGPTSVFRDGLRIMQVTGTVDMAFVDRIEVVKGPASMLYGRIEPGGFTNIVTKKPQAESAIGIQQQVGDWGLLRTTADATGSFNDDKTALYRLIGAFDQSDSWVDNKHRDNKAVAAYLAFKPSQRFEFNVNLEYYDNKMTSPGSWGQVPVIGNRPADLPRHWTASESVMWTDFPYKVNRTLLGVDWTYAMNDAWKLTNRLIYQKTDETQTAMALAGFNGVDTVTQRRFIYNPVKRDIYGANLDLTGEFKTGGVKHKALVGLDYYHYMEDFSGYIGTPATLANLNIFNPTYGNFSAATLHSLVAQASNNVIWHFRLDERGVYAQDQMSIGDRWELVVGGRYSEATRDPSQVYGTSTAACYPNCTGEPRFHYEDSGFTPRAGLLYKLDESTSLYGSYTESFGTNNGVTASGGKIDPQIGIQYELGAKASLFGGKVTTSAALFDLRKKNLLTPDPNNPLMSIPVGEVRSRGLEFDIAGQVTKHISLIGSYTYDQVIITKDNSGNQGKRSPGAPMNSASLWAKYDLAPGATEGWALGAGAYLNGQRQGNNANTYQLPGYGRIDAMVAYRTKAGGKPVSAQLNVQNLFDKKYFEATDGGTNAYYGAPRTAIASVKVDF